MNHYEPPEVVGILPHTLGKVLGDANWVHVSLAEEIRCVAAVLSSSLVRLALGT